MSIVQLDFAEPFFHVEYLENESHCRIDQKSMVINLAEREKNNILLPGGRKIVPLKAAILQDVEITNLHKALVVRDFEYCDLTSAETVEAIKKQWKTLYEMSGIERHKGLPYYKSPKFCTGEGRDHIEINFCYVSKGGVPSGPHRDHDRDFDEVHAQILGTGMMRIYDYDDREHVHQELPMTAGIVHDRMYDKKGKYPWHEYMSVTPGIYCPIELDRK